MWPGRASGRAITSDVDFGYTEAVDDGIALMLLRRALFALPFLLPPVLSAQPVLRLCHDDVDVYPWHMQGNQGLSFRMMDAVARQAGVRVAYTPLPWTRCLASVAAGEQDGALAASYSAERAAAIVYPATDGDVPDRSRRMSSDSYSLYKLKGQPLEWDGKQFRNLHGRIAVQHGYSIGNVIRQLGAEVDDSDKEPAQVLRKLLLGSVAGAALVTGEGEQQRKGDRFGGRIVRLDPPLQTKEYYLVLSHPFVQAHVRLAETLWNKIAVVRQSAAYRQAAAEVGVYEWER